MAPLTFLILALLIPLLLALVFYGLVSLSFVKLGVPRSVVWVLLIAIIVGSLINIPLFAVHEQSTETIFRMRHFFYLETPRTTTTIVAINVGGAVIPIILSLWLATKTPLLRTAIALGIVTLTAYMLARVIPGQGIGLNPFIPPIVSAAAAMILAWRSAAPVAYVSGVLGTLIGADLLHLPEVLDTSGNFLSIGGAGVFDGIFLVGIIAALLSPGGRK